MYCNDLEEGIFWSFFCWENVSKKLKKKVTDAEEMFFFEYLKQFLVPRLKKKFSIELMWLKEF